MTSQSLLGGVDTETLMYFGEPAQSLLEGLDIQTTGP